MPPTTTATPPPRLRKPSDDYGSTPGSSHAAAGSKKEASSMWQVLDRLKFILVLIILEMTVATMFLSTLPNLAGTYLGKKVYSGAKHLDCTIDYKDHTPEHDACAHGLSLAASYNGYSQGGSSLATFLFSPVLGVLSDRYGRRPLLITSQVLGFLPLASLMMFIRTDGGQWLDSYYLTNALNGVVSTIAVSLSYVADLVGEEFRGPGFALVMAGFALAIMLGPFLGGFLPLHLNAYLAVGIGAFNIVYAAVACTESLTTRLSESVHVPLNPFKPMKILVINSMFRRLFLNVVFSSAGEYGHLALVFFAMSNNLDLAKSTVSILVILSGVISFIMQSFFQRPAMKLLGATGSIRWAEFFGIINISLWGVALLSPVHIGRVLVFVAAGVFAPLQMMSFPSVSAIKANNVNDTHQGQVQGALYGLRSLAQALAQLGIPAIYNALPHHQYVAMFSAASLMAIAWVLSLFLPSSSSTGKCKEAVVEAATPILFNDSDSSRLQPDRVRLLDVADDDDDDVEA